MLQKKRDFQKVSLFISNLPSKIGLAAEVFLIAQSVTQHNFVSTIILGH